MTLPSVSIGITTFNRKTEVLRAVTSVMGQTYPGTVQIVVVDDGSTDGTALPEGVHLVRHEQNRGIAEAKNRALRECTGDLVGLLDSDDFYHPNFISRCVEELMKYPEVGLTYTDNYRVTDAGKRIGTDRALDWNLEAWLQTCNLRGDCWLARRSIVMQTALHDERFKLEVDGDLFYQLAEITQFQRIPEALMSVTEHAGRFSRDYRLAAYWHAAGLGKYGHDIKFSFDRADRGRMAATLEQSILDGYAYGESLRRQERVA